MKYLFASLLLSIVILPGTSCGSKKAAEKKEASEKEPSVIGVYRFESMGNGGNSISKKARSVIELRTDSTAVMDVTAGTFAVHDDGRFSFRNDSIFITWNTGRILKSKFEKGTGYYSFVIGSTPYKREL